MNRKKWLLALLMMCLVAVMGALNASASEEESKKYLYYAADAGGVIQEGDAHSVPYTDSYLQNSVIVMDVWESFTDFWKWNISEDYEFVGWEPYTDDNYSTLCKVYDSDGNEVTNPVIPAESNIIAHDVYTGTATYNYSVEMGDNGIYFRAVVKVKTEKLTIDVDFSDEDLLGGETAYVTVQLKDSEGKFVYPEGGFTDYDYSNDGVSITVKKGEKIELELPVNKGIITYKVWVTDTNSSWLYSQDPDDATKNDVQGEWNPDDDTTWTDTIEIKLQRVDYKLTFTNNGGDTGDEFAVTLNGWNVNVNELNYTYGGYKFTKGEWKGTLSAENNEIYLQDLPAGSSVNLYVDEKTNYTYTYKVNSGAEQTLQGNDYISASMIKKEDGGANITLTASYTESYHNLRLFSLISSDMVTDFAHSYKVTLTDRSGNALQEVKVSKYALNGTPEEYDTLESENGVYEITSDSDEEFSFILPYGCSYEIEPSALPESSSGNYTYTLADSYVSEGTIEEDTTCGFYCSYTGQQWDVSFKGYTVYETRTVLEDEPVIIVPKDTSAYEGENGWTFFGWREGTDYDNLSGPIYPAGSEYTATKSVDLYPVWNSAGVLKIQIPVSEFVPKDAVFICTITLKDNEKKPLSGSFSDLYEGMVTFDDNGQAVLELSKEVTRVEWDDDAGSNILQQCIQIPPNMYYEVSITPPEAEAPEAYTSVEDSGMSGQLTDPTEFSIARATYEYYNEYTVSYAAGENATGELASDTVDTKNNMVSLPEYADVKGEFTSSETNKRIIGWEDEDGQFYLFGTDVYIYEDTTFTAVWSNETYTVTVKPGYIYNEDGTENNLTKLTTEDNAQYVEYTFDGKTVGEDFVNPVAVEGYESSDWENLGEDERYTYPAPEGTGLVRWQITVVDDEGNELNSFSNDEGNTDILGDTILYPVYNYIMDITLDYAVDGIEDDAIEDHASGAPLDSIEEHRSYVVSNGKIQGGWFLDNDKNGTYDESSGDVLIWDFFSEDNSTPRISKADLATTEDGKTITAFWVDGYIVEYKDERDGEKYSKILCYLDEKGATQILSPENAFSDIEGWSIPEDDFSHWDGDDEVQYDVDGYVQKTVVLTAVWGTEETEEFVLCATDNQNNTYIGLENSLTVYADEVENFYLSGDCYSGNVPDNYTHVWYVLPLEDGQPIDVDAGIVELRQIGKDNITGAVSGYEDYSAYRLRLSVYDVNTKQSDLTLDPNTYEVILDVTFSEENRPTEEPEALAEMQIEYRYGSDTSGSWTGTEENEFSYNGDYLVSAEVSDFSVCTVYKPHFTLTLLNADGTAYADDEGTEVGALAFKPSSWDGTWGTGSYFRMDAIQTFLNDQGYSPAKVLLTLAMKDTEGIVYDESNATGYMAAVTINLKEESTEPETKEYTVKLQALNENNVDVGLDRVFRASESITFVPVLLDGENEVDGAEFSWEVMGQTRGYDNGNEEESDVSNPIESDDVPTLSEVSLAHIMQMDKEETKWSISLSVAADGYSDSAYYTIQVSKYNYSAEISAKDAEDENIEDIEGYTFTADSEVTFSAVTTPEYTGEGEISWSWNAVGLSDGTDYSFGEDDRKIADSIIAKDIFALNEKEESWKLSVYAQDKDGNPLTAEQSVTLSVPYTGDIFLTIQRNVWDEDEEDYRTSYFTGEYEGEFLEMATEDYLSAKAKGQPEESSADDYTALWKILPLDANGDPLEGVEAIEVTADDDSLDGSSIGNSQIRNAVADTDYKDHLLWKVTLSMQDGEKVEYDSNNATNYMASVNIRMEVNYTLTLQAWEDGKALDEIEESYARNRDITFKPVLSPTLEDVEYTFVWDVYNDDYDNYKDKEPSDHWLNQGSDYSKDLAEQESLSLSDLLYVSSEGTKWEISCYAYADDKRVASKYIEIAVPFAYTAAITVQQGTGSDAETVNPDEETFTRDGDYTFQAAVDSAYEGDISWSWDVYGNNSKTDFSFDGEDRLVNDTITLKDFIDLSALETSWQVKVYPMDENGNQLAEETSVNVTVAYEGDLVVVIDGEHVSGRYDWTGTTGNIDSNPDNDIYRARYVGTLPDDGYEPLWTVYPLNRDSETGAYSTIDDGSGNTISYKVTPSIDSDYDEEPESLWGSAAYVNKGAIDNVVAEAYATDQHKYFRLELTLQDADGEQVLNEDGDPLSIASVDIDYRKPMKLSIMEDADYNAFYGTGNKMEATDYHCFYHRKSGSVSGYDTPVWTVTPIDGNGNPVSGVSIPVTPNSNDWYDWDWEEGVGYISESSIRDAVENKETTTGEYTKYNTWRLTLQLGDESGNVYKASADELAIGTVDLTQLDVTFTDWDTGEEETPAEADINIYVNSATYNDGGTVKNLKTGTDIQIWAEGTGAAEGYAISYEVDGEPQATEWNETIEMDVLPLNFDEAGSHTLTVTASAPATGYSLNADENGSYTAEITLKVKKESAPHTSAGKEDVYPDDEFDENNPTRIDVTGILKDDTEEIEETIYSVEINWGAMAFKYIRPTTVTTWNPTDHTTSDSAETTPGEWALISDDKLELKDGAEEIFKNADQSYMVVFNHSNKSVNVVMNRIAETENYGVTANLSEVTGGVSPKTSSTDSHSYVLGRGVEDILYDITSGTAAQIQLSGEPSTGISEDADYPSTVAKLNVTISKAD